MSERRFLQVARLDLEALESLAPSTGAPDSIWDNLLVRDANGLPILSGTSVTGVIRQAFALAHPDADKRLFGTSYRAGARGESDASSVSVSDGLAVGAKGQVVEGLDADESWRGDPVLEFLAEDQPVQRDHIRLNSAGVVAETAKYTRAALPRGTRFRLQMELRSGTERAEDWATLLGFLKDRYFRIGGATRSGLGLVRVIKAREATLDLAEAKDRAALQNDWSRLDTDVGLSLVHAPNDPLAGFSQRFERQLAPESFFRFGANQPRGLSGDPKAAKMLIEKVITWPNAETEATETPGVAERLVIPASAIKGALRHRTAFHWRCLKELFDEKEREAELTALFGAPRATEGGGKAAGGAGRLVFHDIFLELPEASNVTVMPHSSLDRFTGGVRRRILFSEELLQKASGPLSLRIGLEAEPDDPDLLAAFEDSLDDLEMGWLGLGAGWAKGHGTFQKTSTAEDA